MACSRRILIALLTAAMCGLPGAISQAQTKYPDKPIKLIVPFPPGGLFDTVARPLSEKLKPLLGTIIVENVGGAGSARGASLAAKAEPNGYTLLLAGNASHVIAPLTSQTVTYDPIADFEPIALIGTVGLAVAVNPSVPATTVNELLQLIRKAPGSFTYGSAGTGSQTHMTGEMFKAKTSIPELVHVPYTGGANLVNDIVAGHIKLGFIVLTNQFIDLHSAKKIRLLAVTTPERLSIAPGIPTVSESLPGFVSQNFAALVAPRNTPKAIIDQISSAVATAMSDPGLQKQLAAGGFEPNLKSSPESLRQFLKNELESWRTAIKASGLSAK